MAISAGGTRIEHGVIVAPGCASTLLYWKLIEGPSGKVTVRPFISGRDYHSLHHENHAFNFKPETSAGRITVRPYDGVPSIVFSSNGDFVAQSDWYRNFLYEEEKNRGLDCTEDLATIGFFTWDIEWRRGLSQDLCRERLGRRFLRRDA